MKDTTRGWMTQQEDVIIKQWHQIKWWMTQ